MKQQKLSSDDLLYRQRLPLEIKERMTKDRIRQFVNEYGTDGVYISFSGGKDSTVLMDIAREYDSSIPAVFLDTWLEYPQIRQFVKTYDNVEVIKPAKSMKEIIDECGWCFPSKDVAEMIEAARNGKEWAIRKLNGLNKDGKPEPFREQYKKWRVLVDAPFKISHRCCLEMKEKPAAAYEKRTGKHPIIAIMAEESERRKTAYLRTGCNAFDGNRPMSKPMGFWTEQDVLQYIQKHDIAIASPYGQIKEQGQLDGQLCMFGCGKLETTGEKRTGCMFCPVGCHLDGFSKYKRLKKYNPKVYDYCMEQLGLKEVLEWIDKNIVKK